MIKRGSVSKMQIWSAIYLKAENINPRSKKMEQIWTNENFISKYCSANFLTEQRHNGTTLKINLFIWM